MNERKEIMLHYQHLLLWIEESHTTANLRDVQPAIEEFAKIYADYRQLMAVLHNDLELLWAERHNRLAKFEILRIKANYPKAKMECVV